MLCWGGHTRLQSRAKKRVGILAANYLYIPSPLIAPSVKKRDRISRVATAIVIL